MLEKILETYSNHLSTKRSLIELLESFQNRHVRNNKENKVYQVGLILYKGRSRYELVLWKRLDSFLSFFTPTKRIYLLNFLEEYMNGDWTLLEKESPHEK